MTTINSYNVGPNLYLVQQGVRNDEGTVPVAASVNHVAVIDCSYSMSRDLPNIRRQLKEQVPRLMSEGDTLSVIWFASKGQHGILLKAEPISTLVDLQQVNQQIDRWLAPCGCTGFKEPLEDVEDLVQHFVSQNNRNPVSLFFMSDGHDNQWRPRRVILDVLSRLKKVVTNTTIVEYGYYADRAFLAQMASALGGSHIFAEGFDRYSEAYARSFGDNVSAEPNKTITVQGDVIGGFAFSAWNNELSCYELDGNEITVSADTECVWYLSPTHQGDEQQSVKFLAERFHANTRHIPALSATYAAVSLFSLRMQPKVIFPLLQALGDNNLMNRYTNCFGKQAYTEFMEASKLAAFQTEHRFVTGHGLSLEHRQVNVNAFTLLDVLRNLACDDRNRVLLDDDSFAYNRISRGIASDESTLKFKANKARRGYPVTSLVFNEKRPNVSFKVQKPGYVDLANTRTPEIKKANVPKRFPTKVWRNYAVVKDGLINVDKLPVSLSQYTWKMFRDMGVVEHTARKPAVNVLDLNKIPIINRRMVDSVSAKTFAEKALKLARARATQKVYGSFLKESLGEHTPSDFACYESATNAWLKEKGITPGGFRPKGKTAPARDFYMGKELQVKLKGLSSLPKLADVQKRMGTANMVPGTQFTPGMKLMLPAIREVRAYKKLEYQSEHRYRVWLEDKKQAATKEVRSLLFDMAETRFSIIVGQTWFEEFSSLDENTMTIKDFELGDVVATFHMNEVKIDI